MADNQLLAAMLTVAVQSSKPTIKSKSLSAEAWRHVMNDYKRFLNELEKADRSIDKRGINPD